MWMVPPLYMFVAGLEAVLAGSVVGLLYVCVCAYQALGACLRGVMADFWK